MKNKTSGNEKATVVTIETVVNADLEKVWMAWTEPQHVMLWNNASEDWYTPRAENDLREGGTFSFTMSARDGSFSFDFGGTYTVVKPKQRIEYVLGDNRKVSVNFTKTDAGVKIVESFETEPTHSVEMQQAGWQAILNNFRKHTEAL